MCSNKTIQIDRFFWYFQWTLLDNVGTALVMSTKTYGSNGLDQIWEGFVELKTFLSDFLIYEKNTEDFLSKTLQTIEKQAKTLFYEVEWQKRSKIDNHIDHYPLIEWQFT